MDEFEYIDNRIQDIFSEALLLKFSNGYRFDYDHDMRTRKSDPTRKRVRFTTKKQTAFNSVKILDHSWEPIDTITDKEFWEVFTQECYEHIGCDKLLILNSEHGSEINSLKSNKFKPVHWFSHGYLCSEHWFRLYKDVSIMTEYRPIITPWVCANRLIDNRRIYRLQFLNMLDTATGTYSLLERDPHTGRSLSEIYPQNNISPNSFDEHNNSSAWIVTKEPTPINSAFLHVVTETVIDRVHLTEKIFKPIVLKQPFVLVGGAGCLRYLKDYGFKTFNRWWSEDYDNIQDPVQRMRAVAEIVNWVGKQGKLESLRNQMKETLDYNQHWFHNGFSSSCWDELNHALKHHQTHK